MINSSSFGAFVHNLLLSIPNLVPEVIEFV